MAFATVPELVDEIRAGRMVVILDDEARENEGDLIMAASLVRPEDVNFMAREGRGLICLAMTRERCSRLRLAPMVRHNRRRRPASQDNRQGAKSAKHARGPFVRGAVDVCRIDGASVDWSPGTLACLAAWRFSDGRDLGPGGDHGFHDPARQGVVAGAGGGDFCCRAARRCDREAARTGGSRARPRAALASRGEATPEMTEPESVR